MDSLSREILNQRQTALAAALAAADCCAVVAAGKPIPKPGGLDQTYPFRPHPEYYWLTGVCRPGGAMAYAPDEGWTHFVIPVSDEERLWVADEPTPEGKDIADFADWLARHGSSAVNFGFPLEQIQPVEDLSGELQFQFDAIRRRKDSAEVELVRRAATATAGGYAAGQAMIRPGVTEREIQIELESAVLRAGATGMGYESIIAAGRRAAVLHCQPSAAVVGAEDVVLIDAGGEIDFYTADVTRTYPAGDSFTPEQQAIYEIVLAAELAGIAQCRVGVEWHDVHRTAAGEIATGLARLGILKCSVEEALDSAAVWLFFPHGIGHTVGLGVRDVGGHAPDRPAGRTCCGATPRIDFPLEAGHLVTVEPGIYFVPAILDNTYYRELHAKRVDWERLNGWQSVGGVRIEDNILVTADGPDVLTSMIPK